MGFSKGTFPALNLYIFIILTIIVCILAFFWATGKLSINRNIFPLWGVDRVDTIIFSETNPQVTVEQLRSYLEKTDTVLKDKADKFYELGVWYDIDPAFAIAVARKETSLGKNTCASISRNCNNFFCIKKRGLKSCGEWARYDSVDEGIEDFYRLIDRNYVTNDQVTIAAVGCDPDSGFKTHCYCAGADTPHCPDWVPDVMAFAEEIRST